MCENFAEASCRNPGGDIFICKEHLTICFKEGKVSEFDFIPKPLNPYVFVDVIKELFLLKKRIINEQGNILVKNQEILRKAFDKPGGMEGSTEKNKLIAEIQSVIQKTQHVKGDGLILFLD